MEAEENYRMIEKRQSLYVEGARAADRMVNEHYNFLWMGDARLDVLHIKNQLNLELLMS